MKFFPFPNLWLSSSDISRLCAFHTSSSTLKPFFSASFKHSATHFRYRGTPAMNRAGSSSSVQAGSSSVKSQTSESKQALISLSDKQDLILLGRGLLNLGYTIVSTGGTASALEEAGISVTKVEQLTSFPEMLDGRVKTLHPAVHGGILARRDQQHHIDDLKKHGIGTFDVVVVNLYPFYEKVSSSNEILFEDGVENIDIGGPAMIRAAAKELAREIREFRSPTDGETRMFYEIVVAPKYTEKGLEILKGKSKTLRILEASKNKRGKRSLRQVGGGWLLQDSDDYTPDDIEFSVVSERIPQQDEMDDAKFAWLCVKHIKSNAIVIAKAVGRQFCRQPD